MRRLIICTVAAAGITACGATAASPTTSTRPTAAVASAPAATTAPTPTPKPTPKPTPPPAPAPIVFTASGDKTTPPFHVNGTFTVTWTKITPTDGASCSDVIAGFYAYPKGTSSSDLGSFVGYSTVNGCNSDSTQVNVGPGDYYLTINVANASVIITVTQ